ncbi:hypothetical protein HDV00_008038 [Rhizophlyctis rosea]|nr:hypothetical protein HDV00_008038 [Rhizophlyctis rosea]
MSNRQIKTPFTTISSLHATQTPLPTPSHNEVLVKIHSISLNYRDLEVIEGRYTHHKGGMDTSSPLIPCSDMSGTIIDVGPDVTEWRKGDSVISIFLQAHQFGNIRGEYMKTGVGYPLEGVLQQYRVFPSHALVRKPQYLTHHEAATLPIAAVTAWSALMGLQQLTPGDWVLCQGTGGVSLAGLQIAKASGARTILLSSSDDKLSRAKRELGADVTINYKTTPNWSDDVLSATQNEGVNHILETGGASTLSHSFSCIAFGGQISAIGYVGGKEPPPDVDVNINVQCLVRNVTVKGIINGGRDKFQAMLRAYEARGIRPVVDRVFGFDVKGVGEAFEYLKGGGHFGKVVVEVSKE